MANSFHELFGGSSKLLWILRFFFFIVTISIATDALVFAINLLGVGIFAGLIAYDTQRLKLTYYQLGGDQAALSVATSCMLY